jgi:hypothetical protein
MEDVTGWTSGSGWQSALRSTERNFLTDPERLAQLGLTVLDG